MHTSSTRGYFITLEGIEGVGKSTQAQCIGQWLQAQGIDVLATREPGGTPAAENIRSTLLQHWEEILAPETELLLLFASRAQHIQEVIKPALDAGRWVLCDRFTDASYAYQGYGRGLSLTWIASLEQAVQHGLKPNLTFLLDAPATVGSERVAARKKQADRFEVEHQLFFEKVRQGYLTMAANEPTRYRVIDASGSLAAVQAAIITYLEALLHD